MKATHAYTGLVNSAAEKTTAALETIVNVLSELLSDASDTPGNAVEDVLNGLGGKMGFPGRAIKWSGRVIAGVTDTAGAVVKGSSAVAAGMLTGGIRMLAGLAGLNTGQAKAALTDMGAAWLGALVMIGGKSVSAVQYILFCQAPKRALTQQEIKLLKGVFNGSIAYYNIRLIEGRTGIFSLSSRPFALGNTIYLKRRDISADPGLLVHECVHVWQYQHTGARYAGDAIGAQWFIDDAYNWRKEYDRGKTWTQFNKEAQARFIETVYNKGNVPGETMAVKGAFFDRESAVTNQFMDAGMDLTDFARSAVDVLSSKFNYRLSGRLC